MYVDSNLELSDSQAVTATAISSNVIDLSTVVAGGGASISPNTRQDIGQGEDIYLVVNTAVACTDVGSDATLTITLETDDAVGLGTSVVVLNFGTLAFAAFAAAGTNLVAVKLPSFQYRRYLGLRYTIAAGPLTAGAFDAFLTKDLQKNQIYKSGFTVQ